MNKDEYEHLFKETQEYYLSIGKLSCPIFPAEFIYFEKAGFRHLQYKGRILRSYLDQMRRFRLFKQCKDIITNAKEVFEYREVKNHATVVKFWSIRVNKGSKVVIVVIRQINTGNKHFYSIMHKNTKAS